MLDALNNPYGAPEESGVLPTYSPTTADILFSFEGRIGRGTYWLASIAFGFVYALVVGGLILIAEPLGLPPELSMLFILVSLVPAAWIGLAIEVKRWHDLDKSGWWVLLGLIPYVGGLIKLVFLGFLPGTPGRNNYGPPAL